MGRVHAVINGVRIYCVLRTSQHGVGVLEGIESVFDREAGWSVG
jgi:hypothetical protein